MFFKTGRTTHTTSISRHRAVAHLTRMFLVLAMTGTLLPPGLSHQTQASGDCLLDPTFDRDGRQTTDFFGSEDIARGMVIQPDGKIILVGSVSHGVYSFPPPIFGLARYNSNGSLDRSFGDRGKVATDFGPARATAVALQTDGKIVVAGYAFGVGNFGDFAVVRYNSDGHLDSTFGDGGKLITDFDGGGDEATSIVTQPDDKIIVGGFAQVEGTRKFALVRYNPDGHLDATFDGDGKVITSFTRYGSEIRDIVLQPDGKLIAVGFGVRNPSYTDYSLDFAIARYNSDGQLDATFGGDGKVMRNIAKQDEAHAVALQPDGKIVVAGFINEDFAPPGPHAVLARYNTNGSPDMMFGGGDGVAETDIYTASDLALQPDGKIIVAGEVVPGPDFAVTRYQGDGTLDTSFGSDGKITTDFFCGSIDFANAVALQPDGKIVVGGASWPGITGTSTILDFALARYPAEPTSAQPRLLSVTLERSPVKGCDFLIGVVTLCAPAPAGGLEVKLSDNIAAVSLPSSVTVEAGYTIACFDITTAPVTSTQAGNIVARLDGLTRSSLLIVQPIGVASLFFAPNPTEGPSRVQGTVRLDCPAPRGGLSVQLASRNPGVASPVQRSVHIPRGLDSASFMIRTADVTAPRSAIITATVNGLTRRSVLRVD